MKKSKITSTIPSKSFSSNSFGSTTASKSKIKVGKLTKVPPAGKSVSIAGTNASLSSIGGSVTDIQGDAKQSVVINQTKNDKNKKKAEKIQQEQQLAGSQITRKVNFLQRRTRFDSEQVKALIDIFRRLTSMGTMNRLRFREALANMLGMTDDTMLDRIFRAFDGDNEGSVTETEWVLGLSVILRGRLEEQIAYCYEVYDFNGDQAIGREELNLSLRGCLYPVFGQEDMDLEEGQKDIVELAMKRLDVDRDGVIKYSDFYRAVQTDPIMLQSIGECLPKDKEMMSFIALFDSETRKFSQFLSHPSDPGWEREKNKFDPVQAKYIRKKFRLKYDKAITLKSVFHPAESRNSSWHSKVLTLK